MRRRTIEQIAKAEWGTTQVPQFAIYMLTDGEMLNGSFGGFQRDRDHREINEFMPHLNNGKHYEGMPYIRRFMKRGNIRIHCNNDSINLQFWKIPTIDQWYVLRKLLKDCEDLGMRVYVEKYYPYQRSETFYTLHDFSCWMYNKVNWCLY